MTQLLLVLAVALTVGLIVFGIAVLVGGDDPGLLPAEPDGRSRPLPADRPLAEADLGRVRFDTAVRGYRMDEVDAAVRRVAYDIGYKDELINVLQAEVAALRDGRFPDAEVLRRAREAAVVGSVAPTAASPEAGVPDGEPGSAPEPEAERQPGAEGRADAERDAEQDAGSDAEQDAGPDAEQDAGPDAPAAGGPEGGSGEAEEPGADSGQRAETGSAAPGRR